MCNTLKPFLNSSLEGLPSLFGPSSAFFLPFSRSLIMSCEHCGDAFVTEPDFDGNDNKPKILSCMHILCSRCLANQIRTIPDQQIVMVVCPFCSEPTIKELPGEVSLGNISRTSSYDSDVSLTGIDTTPIDFQPHRSALRYNMDASFDGSDIFPLPVSDFDVQNRSFDAPTYEDIYQQNEYINDSTELDQQSVESEGSYLPIEHAEHSFEHPHSQLQTTELESFAHWTLITVDVLILLYILLNLFGGLDALADRGLVQIYASIDVQNMLYVFLLSHMFLQELPNSSLTQSYTIIDNVHNTYTDINTGVERVGNRHVSDNVAALLVVLDLCAVLALFVSATNETMTIVFHVAVYEIQTMIRTGCVSVLGVAVLGVVVSAILGIVLAVLMYVQTVVLREEGTVYAPHSPGTPRTPPHPPNKNTNSENGRSVLRRHSVAHTPHTPYTRTPPTTHTNISTGGSGVRNPMRNNTTTHSNTTPTETTHPIQSDDMSYSDIYPPYSPTTHYTNPTCTTSHTNDAAPYGEYEEVAPELRESIEHTMHSDMVRGTGTDPSAITSATTSDTTSTQEAAVLSTSTRLAEDLHQRLHTAAAAVHQQQQYEQQEQEQGQMHEAQDSTEEGVSVVEVQAQVYSTPSHIEDKGHSDSNNPSTPPYHALHMPHTALPNYGRHHTSAEVNNASSGAEVRTPYCAEDKAGEGLGTVRYDDRSDDYPVYAFALESKTDDTDTSVDGSGDLRDGTINNSNVVQSAQSLLNLPLPQSHTNTSVVYSPLQPLDMNSLTLPLTPFPLTPLPPVSPQSPLPLPLPLPVSAPITPLVVPLREYSVDTTNLTHVNVVETIDSTATTPVINTIDTAIVVIPPQVVPAEEEVVVVQPVESATILTPPVSPLIVHTKHSPIVHSTPPSPPTTLPLPTPPLSPQHTLPTTPPTLHTPPTTTLHTPPTNTTVPQPALPLSPAEVSTARSGVKKGGSGSGSGNGGGSGWKGMYNQHNLTTPTTDITKVHSTNDKSSGACGSGELKRRGSGGSIGNNSTHSMKSVSSMESVHSVHSTGILKRVESGIEMNDTALTSGTVGTCSASIKRSPHNKAQDSPQSVRAIRKAALRSINNKDGGVGSVGTIGCSNNSSGNSIGSAGATHSIHNNSSLVTSETNAIPTPAARTTTPTQTTTTDTTTSSTSGSRKRHRVRTPEIPTAATTTTTTNTTTPTTYTSVYEQRVGSRSNSVTSIDHTDSPANVDSIVSTTILPDATTDSNTASANNTATTQRTTTAASTTDTTTTNSNDTSELNLVNATSNTSAVDNCTVEESAIVSPDKINEWMRARSVSEQGGHFLVVGDNSGNSGSSVVESTHSNDDVGKSTAATSDTPVETGDTTTDAAVHNTTHVVVPNTTHITLPHVTHTNTNNHTNTNTNTNTSTNPNNTNPNNTDANNTDANNTSTMYDSDSDQSCTSYNSDSTYNSTTAVRVRTKFSSTSVGISGGSGIGSYGGSSYSSNELHRQQVFPEPIDCVVGDVGDSGDMVVVSGSDGNVGDSNNDNTSAIDGINHTTNVNNGVSSTGTVNDSVEMSVLDVSINTLAYSSLYNRHNTTTPKDSTTSTDSATNSTTIDNTNADNIVVTSEDTYANTSTNNATNIVDTSLMNTSVLNSSVYADLLSPTIVSMYDSNNAVCATMGTVAGTGGGVGTSSGGDGSREGDVSMCDRPVDLLSHMNSTSTSGENDVDMGDIKGSVVVDDNTSTARPVASTTPVGDTAETTTNTSLNLHTDTNTSAADTVTVTNTDSTVFAALTDIVDTITVTATTDTNTADDVSDNCDGSSYGSVVSTTNAGSTTNISNTDIPVDDDTTADVDTSIITITTTVLEVLSSMVKTVSAPKASTHHTTHTTSDTGNSAVSTTVSNTNATDITTNVSVPLVTPPLPLTPSILIQSPRKNVAFNAIAQKYIDKISGVSNGSPGESEGSGNNGGGAGSGIVGASGSVFSFDGVNSSDSVTEQDADNIDRTTTSTTTNTTKANTTTTTNTDPVTAAPAPTTRSLHSRAYSMGTALLLSQADSIDTMFDTLQHDVDIISHTIHEHDDIHIVHSGGVISVVRSGSNDEHKEHTSSTHTDNTNGNSNSTSNIDSTVTTSTASTNTNTSTNAHTTTLPTSPTSPVVDFAFVYPDLSAPSVLPLVPPVHSDSSDSSSVIEDGVGGSRDDIVCEVGEIVSEMVEYVHTSDSTGTVVDAGDGSAGSGDKGTSVSRGTSPLHIESTDEVIAAPTHTTTPTTPHYTQPTTTLTTTHTTAQTTHTTPVLTLLSPIHPIHTTSNPTSPEMTGLDLSRIYPAQEVFVIDREDVCSANEGVFETYSDVRSVEGKSSGSDGAVVEQVDSGNDDNANVSSGSVVSVSGEKADGAIASVNVVPRKTGGIVYSPYNYTTDTIPSPMRSTATSVSTSFTPLPTQVATDGNFTVNPMKSSASGGRSTTPNTSVARVSSNNTISTPTLTRSRSTIRASIHERMNVRLNKLNTPTSTTNTTTPAITTSAANNTNTSNNTNNTTALNTPDDINRFEDEMHTMYNMYVQTNSTYNSGSFSQPSSGANIGRNSTPRVNNLGSNGGGSFSPVRGKMVSTATSPMKFSRNAGAVDTNNGSNNANSANRTEHTMHVHSIDADEGDYIPSQTLTPALLRSIHSQHNTNSEQNNVNPTLLRYHSTQQAFQHHQHTTQVGILNTTTISTEHNSHNNVAQAIVAEMSMEVSVSPPTKLKEEVLHHSVHSTHTHNSNAATTHNHVNANTHGTSNPTQITHNNSNNTYSSSNTYPNSAISSAYSSAYSMYDHNSSLYDIHNTRYSPHTVDTTTVRVPTPVYTNTSPNSTLTHNISPHTTNVANVHTTHPTHHIHPTNSPPPIYNMLNTHATHNIPPNNAPHAHNTHNTHHVPHHAHSHTTNPTPNTYTTHPTTTHPHLNLHTNLSATSGMVRSARTSPVPTTPIRKHASMSSKTINNALAASRNASIRGARSTNTNTHTKGTAYHPTNSTSTTHPNTASSGNSSGTSSNVHTPKLAHSSSVSSIQSVRSKGGSALDCVSDEMDSSSSFVMVIHMNAALTTHRCINHIARCIAAVVSKCQLKACPVAVLVAPPVGSGSSGGSGGFTYLYAVSNSRDSTGSSGDVEYIVKVRSKPCYLISPNDTTSSVVLTERMFRNALTALVNLDTTSRSTHTTLHSATNTKHSASMSSVYTNEDPRVAFENHLHALRVEIRTAISVFAATSDVVVVCDGTCWPFHSPPHIANQSSALSQWLVYRSSVPYLQFHFVAISTLSTGSTSGNVSVSSK